MSSPTLLDPCRTVYLHGDDVLEVLFSSFAVLQHYSNVIPGKVENYLSLVITLQILRVAAQA